MIRLASNLLRAESSLEYRTRKVSSRPQKLVCLYPGLCCQCNALENMLANRDPYVRVVHKSCKLLEEFFCSGPLYSASRMLAVRLYLDVEFF